MALEMRPECERCATPVPPRAEAWICLHECTYCPACALELANLCPNCGNELVRRPRLSKETAA